MLITAENRRSLRQRICLSSRPAARVLQFRLARFHPLGNLRVAANKARWLPTGLGEYSFCPLNHGCYCAVSTFFSFGLSPLSARSQPGAQLSFPPRSLSWLRSSPSRCFPRKPIRFARRVDDRLVPICVTAATRLGRPAGDSLPPTLGPRTQKPLRGDFSFKRCCRPSADRTRGQLARGQQGTLGLPQRRLDSP